VAPWYFFNLTTCPSGWVEFATARGRYIVGLPGGGTLGGGVGTTLTNLENRAAGLHNHGVTDLGHSHVLDLYGTADSAGFSGIFDSASPAIAGAFMTDDAVTNISIQNNTGTVAGTNAPYIQLLVCQKG
jgi:hypothetical protein